MRQIVGYQRRNEEIIYVIVEANQEQIDDMKRKYVYTEDASCFVGYIAPKEPHQNRIGSLDILLESAAKRKDIHAVHIMHQFNKWITYDQ